VIHYICKYTPVELFASFGEEASLFNPMPENLDVADTVTHRNMCSFSRALISERLRDGSEMLVLTDCCDSIRRTQDVLRSNEQDTMMLSLPRKSDRCGKALYKEELIRVTEYLEKQTGKPFDPEAFRLSFHPAEQIEGPYIAVMGARLGEKLMDDIRKLSPLPVRNNTCTAGHRLAIPSRGSKDQLLDWYASELLSQTACMRMADITSRRALTEDPNLRGVVYNTVKFCDFYGFEYGELRESLQVPLLKIETDYTPQSEAQIRTRLQAFFEGMTKPTKEFQGGMQSTVQGYAAGIDSGSTSTNAVILDEKKRIVTFCTIPTGVSVSESAHKALDVALKKAGLDRMHIRRIVTTGYGRMRIAFRERDVTEITCHAKGAHFLDPSVRTVIDIGGQDSKIIRLDENGTVRDFVMNDKCAAGSGRFLEMMAQSLGITLEEMSVMGFEAEEDIVISSMCSVFAQSEVVSLIASGKRLQDIVHGINCSVAAKVTTLAGRSGLQREWMMTGGVARNRGVVAAIEERLQGKLLIPEEPEICGALGAALVALESGTDG